MLKNSVLHKIIFAIWVLLVGVCFEQLLTYANTPGVAANAPAVYPADSAIKRTAGFASLVIFGHPHCPCSKASVGELERLMPHIQTKIKTTVVFVRPEDKSEDWAKEALWNQAHAIPGVDTIVDGEGIEAAKFGAATSGQTFLYDETGKLVFRGGITAARGHMGDNQGRDSILSFVETGEVLASTTPVFGCSLKNPERNPASKGTQ